MIKLNGKPINITMFSDNTSQVWKLPNNIIDNTKYVVVEWEFVHEGEFMQLTQLKYLLDYKHFKTDLIMSYLPYARQDKVPDNFSTFALYPFTEL